MLIQIVYSKTKDLRMMEMGFQLMHSVIRYKIYFQCFHVIIQIVSRRILKLVKLLISNQISASLRRRGSKTHQVMWIFQIQTISVQSFLYAFQNKTNQKKINQMIKISNLQLFKFKEIKFINQLKASSKVITMVASLKNNLLHQK